MATVAELIPGDLVTQAGMSGVFISRSAHPIWPYLMLVTWRLHDRWSLDALDPMQEVGEVVPSAIAERQARLRAALLAREVPDGT